MDNIMSELENYLWEYYKDEYKLQLCIKIGYTTTAEVGFVTISPDAKLILEGYETRQLRLGDIDHPHRECSLCEYLMLFRGDTNILTCDNEECENYWKDVYDYEKHTKNQFNENI